MSDKVKSTGLEVPKPDLKDTLYSVGEAFSSVLPFAGPELFRLIVSPSLESRRLRWMEEVSRRLLELEGRGLISVSSLAQDEEFVSVFIETSKVALAEHENEKLVYLQNALINSALHDLTYDIKFSLLKAISALTPRHVLILKYVKGFQEKQFPSSASKGYAVMKLADQYFSGSRDIVRVFWNDLHQMNFLERQGRSEETRKDRDENYKVSNWGKNFLAFITIEEEKR